MIQTAKEDGAGFVIKKMRNRFCRQAFDLYKLHVKQLKQYEKDLARLKCYKELTDARRLRTTFNAMCVYRNNFIKAKNYWTIVLTKMDLWMKRKMFIKWQTQGNDKMEQVKKAKQNNETEVLGGKQKVLKSEQLKRDDKDR
jgi:hypothetical protein